MSNLLLADKHFVSACIMPRKNKVSNNMKNYGWNTLILRLWYGILVFGLEFCMGPDRVEKSEVSLSPIRKNCTHQLNIQNK